MLGQVRRAALLLVAVVMAVLPFQREIHQSLSQAKEGWQRDPAEMTAKIVFSFAVGQSIFWFLGSDQLGLFMDPKVKMGLGLRVGDWIQQRLPAGAKTAWVIKALEVITDASRVMVEGDIYIARGYAPDALAVAVTQPLWSTIEAAEKIAGAVIHPERVNDPEQVRQSLSNIYGSAFRWLQVWLLWRYGERLYRLIGLPIERGLRRAIER